MELLLFFLYKLPYFLFFTLASFVIGLWAVKFAREKIRNELTFNISIKKIFLYGYYNSCEVTSVRIT
jgi:hypothetical protein